MIFLSEFKIANVNKATSLDISLGYNQSYCVPANGSSGGLLLL